MPEQEESNIHLRSEEVQEILGAVPNWTIRWGITLIFSLIILLLFLSWFIKYPDVISANITISTEEPPIQLITKSAGKIVVLKKKDGDFVKQGETIAEIENPLSGESAKYLKTLSPQVRIFLEKTNFKLAFADSDLNFGAIQSSYNNLKKQCLDYQDYKTQKYEEKSIQKLNEKINYYNKLSEITTRQVSITEKELQNATEKYEANKKLYEEGVFAKAKFFEQESAFRQAQQSLENIKKTQTQNQITILDLEKQVLDLTFQVQEKERNFKENIRLNLDEIESNLINWEQSYLLTAPIEGELSYLSALNQNQFVNAGQNLFAVVPQNQNYIGNIEIPTQGFGKVKTKQTVKIRLAHYPYNEYGQVDGNIQSISLIAKENLYRAKVALPNGLRSSYKKDLAFKPEMAGTAQIITEDLRLIERVFNSFRELFDR
jgi:multidrug resistance efflux pump